MEIPGLNTGSSQKTSSNISPGTIEQEEFLILLMTQLRYQDPLNPIDNAQFTSQLAQLRALEQLDKMNSKLGDLLLYQNSMQNTFAATLIGKEVEVSGDEVYLKDSAGINYNLESNASKVTISVYDSLGKLVRQVGLNNQTSGDHAYVWDGKDGLGNKLAEGRYVITVNASDIDGNPVGVSTTVKGVVTGMTFEDDITYLIINGNQKVQLGDIRTITQGGA